VDPFNTARIVEGWEGSFSRDGKSIVYIKERGKPNEPDPYIYLAGADGTGERPILKGLQQALPSINWPVLSPDNRWIYFYAAQNRSWTPERSVGRFHLYRVSPQYGAKPQKLTDADLLPVSPHFNSDGSLLLVKRDVGSTRSSVEIARLDPDSRKLETVSRIGEPVSGATFIPAGDSLIFTTDRGIFRRSTHGGNITVDLARRELFYPMISPDGQNLLVYNRQNQALLIDRRDGTIIYLGRSAVPFGSFGSKGNLILTQLMGGKRWLVRLKLDATTDVTEKFMAAFKEKK
jgi:Tol biopolymer transport system component